MNVRGIVIALVALLGLSQMAEAQDKAWLQIEAQPSLTAAQDRAGAYSALFPDVAGFQIKSGW